jgi:hypothetical protein
VVNEAQHRRWRDDIRANIDKANKAAGESSGGRFSVALTAIEVTSRVILAERISELAQAILHNDETVSRLHDANLEAETILDGLASHNFDIEPSLEMVMGLQAQAESWIAAHGSIGEVPIEEGGPSRETGEAPTHDES